MKSEIISMGNHPIIRMIALALFVSFWVVCAADFWLAATSSKDCVSSELILQNWNTLYKNQSLVVRTKSIERYLSNAKKKAVKTKNTCQYKQVIKAEKIFKNQKKTKSSEEVSQNRTLITKDLICHESTHKNESGTCVANFESGTDISSSFINSWNGKWWDKIILGCKAGFEYKDNSCLKTSQKENQQNINAVSSWNSLCSSEDQKSIEDMNKVILKDRKSLSDINSAIVSYETKKKNEVVAQVRIKLSKNGIDYSNIPVEQLFALSGNIGTSANKSIEAFRSLNAWNIQILQDSIKENELLLTEMEGFCWKPQHQSTFIPNTSITQKDSDSWIMVTPPTNTNIPVATLSENSTNPIVNPIVSIAQTATNSPIIKGAISIEADSLTPAKQILVAGMTNVEVLRFKVRADNREDIRLDKLTVGAAATNTATDLGKSFANVKLYDGSTQINWAPLIFKDNKVESTGLNFVVPKAGTKSISVRVDTTASATLEKGTTIAIAPVAIEYTGVAGGNLTPLAAVANTLAPSAAMLLQDVKVTVASTMASSTSKVTGSTNQDIATYSIKAEGTRDASIKTLKVTLSGNGAASVSNVRLRYNSTDYATATVAGGVATFNLAASPIVVTAGNTISIGIRADTSAITPAANETKTLQTSINGVSGAADASNGVVYTYTDANAVASGDVNTSDSYPVSGAVISY